MPSDFAGQYAHALSDSPAQQAQIPYEQVEQRAQLCADPAGQHSEQPAEHFDVLVIGAGLSGIGAAYHLQTRCPNKRYAILEARAVSGGTWDLFRYPGVRSDSDMYTLGYRFRPWLGQKAITDGPSILQYIRDTATEYGIDKRIRYGHRLIGASWSSTETRWTLEVEVTAPASDVATQATSTVDPAVTGSASGVAPDMNTSPSDPNLDATDDGVANGGVPVASTDARNAQPSASIRVTFTCNVLYSCMGYYDYSGGFTPDFRGIENFRGTIVHPQRWPESLVYRDKRVVVIGSGATAVTLVPAMAKTAAHVTMLQRSPTYVMSQPSRDRLAQTFRAILPVRAAYAATRWKNVAFSIGSFWIARTYPQFMKRFFVERAKDALRDRGVMKSGSADARRADTQAVAAFDVETHFGPRYNPWDQRICVAPDADFFRAMKSGKATVVTDVIDTFTANGVRLQSGKELEADIIVTATGLQLRLLSGATLVVDGRTMQPSETMAYKGMMFSDLPNFVSAFGYTNASWTLKVDLTAGYVCRLLQYMDRHGYRQCTPRQNDPTVTAEPILDFTSGYVKRALGDLPSQGSRAPWRVHQNYARDLMTIRFGKLDDGVLEFQ